MLGTSSRSYASLGEAQKPAMIREWECPECGLIVRSSYPPDECPSCGEPGSSFDCYAFESDAIEADDDDVADDLELDALVLSTLDDDEEDEDELEDSLDLDDPF